MRVVIMTEALGMGMAVTTVVTPYLTFWDYFFAVLILVGVPALTIYAIWRLYKKFFKRHATDQIVAGQKEYLSQIKNVIENNSETEQETNER